MDDWPLVDRFATIMGQQTNAAVSGAPGLQFAAVLPGGINRDGRDREARA